MWLRAKKVRHVARLEDFVPPLQVRGFSPDVQERGVIALL